MKRTAVAPQLHPSSHASRWARIHAPDSPVCTLRYTWNASTPSGDERDGDERPPLPLRQIAMAAATAQATHERRSRWAGGRAQRGSEPGEQPSLPMQEQQARRGAHDQRRFGSTPRHHDGAREQARTGSSPARRSRCRRPRGRAARRGRRRRRDSTTLTPSSAWSMPPGKDVVEPACEHTGRPGRTRRSRRRVGDVGDVLRRGRPDSPRSAMIRYHLPSHWMKMVSMIRRVLPGDRQAARLALRSTSWSARA